MYLSYLSRSSSWTQTTNDITLRSYQSKWEQNPFETEYITVTDLLVEFRYGTYPGRWMIYTLSVE